MAEFCQKTKKINKNLKALILRFAKKNDKFYLCQSWSAVDPHRSMFLINEKHNFCRNPTNDPKGAWCYTTNKNVHFAYCDIPIC
ncbi:unnamed protein product [Oikopleura dioica]|uniref:Kringle domain-containing protein n=1 Tax=Oikopleura dioica TaxID=34765 RepID=E4XS91_OIKDI|nr:unnamed protein product [Oikopleura dioica]CBY32434.1 unnamed protein product [Oikopleura dioica]